MTDLILRMKYKAKSLNNPLLKKSQISHPLDLILKTMPEMPLRGLPFFILCVLSPLHAGYSFTRITTMLSYYTEISVLGTCAKREAVDRGSVVNHLQIFGSVFC